MKSIALVASANDLRKTLLSRELNRLGMEVETASLGWDAVVQLERVAYAAVIVDDSLPDLSALELGLVARDILGTNGTVLLVAPAYKQCVGRLHPVISLQCFDDVNSAIAVLPDLVAPTR